MMMNFNKDVEFVARARAFRSVRTHRFSVSGNGTVRVWDSIAHHFTTCHELSESAQARLRRLAVCSSYGCELLLQGEKWTIHRSPCPLP